MPDEAELFTEARNHGDMMPDAEPNDPPNELSRHGEPMPDEADKFTQSAESHGEPMNDEANESTETQPDGAPTPDQAEPSTDCKPHGESMPDQADLFTEPRFHGAQMTDDEATADTQPMLTREDVARATLIGFACELGHDEVRVLARIAERLRGGRFVYGPLDLTTDTRMFRTQEAREELEDALVYFACAWLKTEANLEVTR
jgi:hypothetical protein